ncbi:MAG: hypothetical protein Q8R35_01190 [bacterium]|nr:hypothetical protein [bacterium]
MMRTPGLIREHWAAVLLALGVGFLLILPPLWVKVSQGLSFNDPVNIRIADEFYYFARIRDVLDGYPLSGNAYLWEHKADPPGQPVFLGEYLTAQAIRMTGLDVVAGSAVLDFVLPVFAVLLTYACLFAVTASRGFSLLGAAVLFLGFFRGDFTRTVSPQMNFLFWLSQFFLLYQLAAADRRGRARAILAVAAAANFGLLFYLYPYYWTFYLAFLGIAFLFALAGRAYGYARALAAVAGGGLAVALPYLWLMVRTVSSPAYAETVRRIGMIDSHFPSGIAIVVPALVLLVLGVLAARVGALGGGRSFIFFASGTLAAMVSVNQHVITGKNIEFSSHYYPLSVFWFTFFSAYLVVSVVRHVGRQRVVAILAGVAAAAMVAFGVWQSIPPQFSVERGNLRRYLPLFAWFRAYAIADEVVLAPPAISSILPIYTGNNVLFSHFARLSLVGDEEILDRFTLAVYHDPPEPASAVGTVFGVQYLDAALHTVQENKVRRLFGLAPKDVIFIPPPAIERIAERRRVISGEGWERALNRYRVDYVVLDRASPRAMAWDERYGGRKVYDADDLVVYQLSLRR